MKKKTGHFSPPAVGGSSLLAIFALLTLCVFALLSLATVLAEKRLSEAAAVSVVRYYDADLRAEEVYAQLKTGHIPEDVTVEEGVYRYVIPMAESQWLITEFEEINGQWRILRWQTYARSDRAADEHLPVWTGTTP